MAATRISSGTYKSLAKQFDYETAQTLFLSYLISSHPPKVVFRLNSVDQKMRSRDRIVRFGNSKVPILLQPTFTELVIM